MNLPALVSSFRARGAVLAVCDGRLRVEAPARLLTPADREALRQHRDELVALLRADAARRPASAEQKRPRAAYDGLNAEERRRLEQEAAGGDTIARLVLETLTPHGDPYA